MLQKLKTFLVSTKPKEILADIICDDNVRNKSRGVL